MQNNIFNFIKVDLMILIPVLLIAKKILKKTFIEKKKIQIILGIMGMLLSSIWVFATSEIKSFQDVLISIFVSMSQGILVIGSAVFLKQVYIKSGQSK